MKKTVLALLLLALPATAHADDLHADAEVDPTAYVLDGYSLHVGVGWDRVRVDLGAYAMALPDAIDGSDDFSVAFDGYGVKVQYFVLEPQRGPFVGVDGGVARLRVSRDGTDLSQRRTTVGAGVHAGWRFAITEELYATAWLGVGYSTDAADVMLDGETYEPTRVTVFPAVHVGYRFR
jgi:hypothetical protein